MIETIKINFIVSIQKFFKIKALDGTFIDKKCPFTGNVSIRGRILTGVVIKTKMTRTIVLRRDYLHFIRKYNRFEKRPIKRALSLDLSATTEQKPSNEIEQEEDVKLESSKDSEKKSNNLTLALSISKGFFINFTFVALSIGPFFVASVFDFDKTWPAYAHLYL